MSVVFTYKVDGHLYSGTFSLRIVIETAKHWPYAMTRAIQTATI
jgi:hypothetical protein